MHTISAKKEQGFKVEVFGNNGEVVYSAWHLDRNEAQAVAEAEQRKVLFPVSDAPSLDDIFAEMDDDELLRELGA